MDAAAAPVTLFYSYAHEDEALQIELVTARGSDKAAQLIAADAKGFGLVISDWERAGELAQAGSALPDSSDPPAPLSS